MKKRKLLSIGHSYVVSLNRSLLRELSRMGWDVTAVSPTSLKGTSADLRPLGVERDRNEPFELLTIPARFTRSPHFMFYDPKLWSVLNRREWDLIHLWEEPYLVVGATIAAAAPRAVPLVPYSFQNLSKRYPIPFRWTEQYVLHRSAGWIAAGQTVHRALHARPGYRDRPSTTITLGVDLEVFRPPSSEERLRVRESLGWSDHGPPVVGFSGRFVPEKGLSVLMQALDGSRAPFRALFIGAGPLESDLRRWAARHAPRVAVVTGVSHGQVPRYLGAMDLLCAPSETTPFWSEQFGRMLVEAMGCRVPVIGSDSGEIPYVIGHAGLVAPERDVEAWRHAIDSLLESPDRRRTLADAGLQRAHDRFTWNSVARAHDEFFQSLMPA